MKKAGIAEKILPAGDPIDDFRVLNMENKLHEPFTSSFALKD